ncbi:EF-P 5-aminopentanol modification-associated protein YfmH [Allofustis seminis]|uniref:EF-P 5-aminopentanol modification-associated protein YfmH n=1 Tax=Allofustis seminis TaxID=166939 RepID=UPI00037D8498|nr:pitrilysin family protein [Allofustis seminis]
MKIYQMPTLEETTYEYTLENGLTVYLHPKPDYQRTFAIFNTTFGSVDIDFVPLGEKKWVHAPLGVAHFLEHKLFEKEFGDVFELFSEQGASANAFTSYEQTAYLFSTVDHVDANLNLLLDFVQTPYFTEQTVEKEKGIIAQEILMYDDMPEWRIQRLLLENLYPKHPVRHDIAGTVESIQAITPDILYENYRTFYHPENMQLFVIGPIDVEKTLQLIKANQSAKEFAPLSPIQRRIDMASVDEICPFRHEKAALSRPKVMFGIRGPIMHYVGEEKVKRDLAIRIGLSLLFSMTSSTYLTLYDEGLIDDSFNFTYETARTFNHIMLECDTKYPEEFLKRVKNILLTRNDNSDLSEQHLELVKRKKIGDILHQLNSLEYIAQNFLTQKEEATTIFDHVQIIQALTLPDIKKYLDEVIQEEAMSSVILG